MLSSFKSLAHQLEWETSISAALGLSFFVIPGHSFIHCRDFLWGSCISMLTTLPRVLRLMLQSLQVTTRVRREELPVLAQLLRLLMQHGQLRPLMVTNELLVKQILKDLMVRDCSLIGESR